MLRAPTLSCAAPLLPVGRRTLSVAKLSAVRSASFSVRMTLLGMSIDTLGNRDPTVEIVIAATVGDSVARPATFSAPVPARVPKVVKLSDAIGAGAFIVIVPLLRFVMLTVSLMVGTAAHDHLAALCQSPLPPVQLQVRASAGTAASGATSHSAIRRARRRVADTGQGEDGGSDTVISFWQHPQNGVQAFRRKSGKNYLIAALACDSDRDAQKLYPQARRERHELIAGESAPSPGF